MRPYVKKIESNFKSGVVAQPGRKTLIVGLNGTGKSAIVNAVEAAGSGKVSDVAGRALLAKDADLSMLAHGEKVWALAKLEGGGESRFELAKGHRAKLEGTAISFPLRDVRDAILGSPETARKWVLEVGAKDLDWARDVVPLIAEPLRPLLASADVNGVEAIASIRLSLAIEEARRRVREANASAKAARGAGAPAGPPPSDEEIERLSSIIRGWEARGEGGAIDSTREALTAARANADTLAARIASYDAELNSIGAVTPTTKVREAAVLVLETLTKSGAKTCICGCSIDPAQIATRAMQGRQRIAQESQRARRKMDLEFAGREALADLTSARREIQRFEIEEARLMKLSKDPEALGAPLAMGLDEARTALRTAHDRRAGWDAARRAETRALESEREATEWTQLAEALSRALGVLVEKARVAFESSVQRFLPAGDVFGLDLLDGDREILRVGLRRGASLDAALSGAEWARVTAAIALATAPATGPCVIVPEERAFDPEMLSRVLAAWDAALTGDDAPQVMITSPVEPTKVPPGWTVIQTGKIGDSETDKKIVARADHLLEKSEPVASPADPFGSAPTAPTAPKRRGRPPGSKNKPQAQPAEVLEIFTPKKNDAGETTGLEEKPAAVIDDIFR